MVYNKGMNNFTEDLSTLTGIKQNTIKNLITNSKDIIGHCILESVLNREPVCNVDIGIGKLYINIVDTDLTMKFIPDNSLIKTIKTTIDKQQSPITNKLVSNIEKQINHTYKELL